MDVAGLAEIALQCGMTFLGASYFRAENPDVGFRLAYGELSTDELREGSRRLGLALDLASEPATG